MPVRSSALAAHSWCVCWTSLTLFIQGGGFLDPPIWKSWKTLEQIQAHGSAFLTFPLIKFASWKKEISQVIWWNVNCQSGRMLPFHTFWTPLESTLEWSSMWRMRPLLILLSLVGTWQSPLYSHLSCGGAQMVSPERPCWRCPSCCQTNPSRMTTRNTFLRVRRGAASASKNWLGHRVTSPRKMPCPKWGPCAPDVISPLAGST